MRARGERHGRAKLTEEQVIIIRTNGKSVRSTAREFGISRATVRRIRDRILWSHI